MKRDIPLQIITGATKDLIVPGTLESEERSILDLAMYQGQGIGLDRTSREEPPQQVQVKKEYSAITPSLANPTISIDSNAPAEHTTPSTSSGTANTQVRNRDKLHSAKAKTQLPQFKLQKSLRISINKITVQEGERVKVTENMLAKLPISSLHDESTTEGYESTETEIYWPISPKPIEILNTPEGDRQHKTEKPTLKQENLKLGRGLLQPRKRMIYAKPSQFMFKINTIGIKRKKPKYYFKCIANNCSKMFDNLQTWNTHHRIHHNTPIKCTVCKKSFKTPSVARSHKNSHAVRKHKCTQCSKIFAYSSALRLHKNAHARIKHHKCFHGNCKKSYRWPQDLSRHIQRHLKMSWSCEKCEFTTYENHLLKRHRAAHVNYYKYKCNNCTYESKWPTPFARHQTRCKAPT